MNDKLKPALIGGAVLGLLSVIPFVNFGNYCCCLWALLGGAIATNIYVKNSPTPATAGDGAIVGILAGVVGGVIVVVLGIPINLLAGAAMREVIIGLVQNMDPAQVDMIRQQMLSGETLAGTIVGQLISAVLLAIFATLGGLLGIPIFEKRKANLTPPPPPSGYGP